MSWSSFIQKRRVWDTATSSIAPINGISNLVLIGLLLKEHASRHQRSLDERTDLAQKITSRRYMISAEAEDLIVYRQALLDDAVAQGLETSEQGFSRSRFRAIRNGRDMAVHAHEIRLARLDGLTQALQQPEFSEYKLLILTIE